VVLPRVVMLTAHPDDVRRVERPLDVQLLAVEDVGHLDLLRAVHGEVGAGVPARGGAVLAVRGAQGLAAAGWTEVEHGTSELVGVVTVGTERRRGLGALVVGAATTGAARAGADLVWLRTQDAGALRLYRSLGFEPTGTCTRDWP
jgi:predicted GNAT family acetyltransferase